MQPSSDLFFNALGYVFFIILSGIAFLTCFIFMVIRLTQDHKNKWNWLIVTAIALLTLLVSIYIFSVKVVTTVKNIGASVEEQFDESIKEIQKKDSSYHYTKLESNKMVKQLLDFDNMKGVNNAPKEFYVYYGYMDYYRMPLAFPYSIHCSDVLETGALFNEQNVVDFNVNDNGEVSCDLENIKSIAFDSNVLITQQNEKKPKQVFYIYEFATGKKTESYSKAEAFKIARKQFNYRGYDTLITILEYNKLFN